MKIEKVTYQKTYSIGPYLTERIGFEASSEGIPGDHPHEMLSMLRESADAWHRKNNPHLYQEEGIKGYMHSELDLGYGPGVAPPVDMSKYGKSASSREQIIDYKKTDDEKEHVKANIISSVSIEYLAQWKMLAGKHNLTTEYMNRFKELTK